MSYGESMKAPFRRQTKLIGAQWLRSAMVEKQTAPATGQNVGGGSSSSCDRGDPVDNSAHSLPPNQGLQEGSNGRGSSLIGSQVNTPFRSQLLTHLKSRELSLSTNYSQRGPFVNESKKRRVGPIVDPAGELGHVSVLGRVSELETGYEEGDIDMVNENGDHQKNLNGAGSGLRTRQEL